MSQGHQENSAFPLCMGREKLNNRIVVKGEPGGTEPLSIGSQVEFSPQDASLQLGGSIPPITQLF
jgi:hypothetical protein